MAEQLSPKSWPQLDVTPERQTRLDPASLRMRAASLILALLSTCTSLPLHTSSFIPVKGALHLVTLHCVLDVGRLLS